MPGAMRRQPRGPYPGASPSQRVCRPASRDLPTLQLQPRPCGLHIVLLTFYGITDPPPRACKDLVESAIDSAKCGEPPRLQVAQGCFDDTHMQELKVWDSFILRIDTLRHEGLASQKVMGFSHLTFMKQNMPQMVENKDQFGLS